MEITRSAVDSVAPSGSPQTSELHAGQNQVHTTDRRAMSALDEPAESAAPRLWQVPRKTPGV